MTDPPNGLGAQLVNAGILAGLGFFSTLASLTAVGITTDPVTSLTAAAISAGVNFFTTLALQRGLRRGE